MHQTYIYYKRDIIIFLLAMTGIFAIAIYLALGKVEAKGEIDYNCSEFPSKKDAQRFFENNNPEEDPYNLDGNNNGLACEHL